MNLSYTLYVTADAKAVFSILYSSGNIQIKSCWVGTPPPPSQFADLRGGLAKMRGGVWGGFIPQYALLVRWGDEGF